MSKCSGWGKVLNSQFRKHLLQFNTSWGKEQKLHFYPSKCCLFKNFKHVDNVLWPYLHFQVPHFKPSQALLHAPLPASYLLFDNPLSAALLKWVQSCPSGHGQPAGAAHLETPDSPSPQWIQWQLLLSEGWDLEILACPRRNADWLDLVKQVLCKQP